VTDKLKKKLETLPKTPGVYFHKNIHGDIIYIGKAANLRNRVRQYFQKSRARDIKTDTLVSEITDVEWRELETEADALFLEAELIRRYLPPYNILMRDDKSSIFVRVDYKSDFPTVTTVRRPIDDGAVYFGPYFNAYAIRKALRYLRRAFPYATGKPTGQKRASLYYHIGLDPGLEEGRTSLEDYRVNLRKLMQYLSGERVKIVRDIERDMKRAAKNKDFEQAVKLRNQLFSLQALSRQSLFGDREALDASRDYALVDLCNLLGLKNPPVRIEGFDISHMQGTDTVASMVVFINGIPDKASYRKFKMRLLGNDDFAHMNETLTRRLREENRKKWSLPDLILIDGGKGQLSAAIAARDNAKQSHIPMIGLAKREEEIIIHKELSAPGVLVETFITQAQKHKAYITESSDFISILLPQSSHSVKLLQRIRDESHRFAVSYHSSLKRTRQTLSLLDEIPGIGPNTRRKLIRHFGSLKAVTAANTAELEVVVGPYKAASLSKYLNATKQIN
jgi:excinuclease ABC subunit C